MGVGSERQVIAVVCGSGIGNELINELWFLFATMQIRDKLAAYMAHTLDLAPVGRLLPSHDTLLNGPVGYDDIYYSWFCGYLFCLGNQRCLFPPERNHMGMDTMAKTMLLILDITSITQVIGERITLVPSCCLKM